MTLTINRGFGGRGQLRRGGSIGDVGQATTGDSFLQDFFGLDRQQFLQASPQTRRSSLNIRQGAPFDPRTGLPLRPARTLTEAANFEFAQNLFVNRLARQNQARAAAAIQSQIGLVQRGGVGSLQQLLSPAFGQLANILGTTTFQPFDFTAGVVQPRVGSGGRRGRGTQQASQLFGGISDPFGGGSIRELFGAQQQPFQFQQAGISQGFAQLPPLGLVSGAFDQTGGFDFNAPFPGLDDPISGFFEEGPGDFAGEFGDFTPFDEFGTEFLPEIPPELAAQGIGPDEFFGDSFGQKAFLGTEEATGPTSIADFNLGQVGVEGGFVKR